MCTDCQPGYYQNEMAKISCKECPQGFKQDKPRRTECIDCVKGRFSNESAPARCIECELGKWQSNPTSKQCHEVEPGYERRGPALQEQCPAGRSGQGGSNMCTDCKPGYYQNESSKISCKSSTARPTSGAGGQSPRPQAARPTQPIRRGGERDTPRAPFCAFRSRDPPPPSPNVLR